MLEANTTIHAHVAAQNQHKVLFTAGPASLLEENLLGLRPCFGRGDLDYNQVDHAVLSALKQQVHKGLVEQRLDGLDGPSTVRNRDGRSAIQLHGLSGGG